MFAVLGNEAKSASSQKRDIQLREIGDGISEIRN
jgi:hypothetical protein